MTLSRRTWGLIAALAFALAVQVPMFPGMGLEARDLSRFASWYQTISMTLFPALMVSAVAAIVLVRNHPRSAAWAALAFGAGMVPITLLDLTGWGGVSPPATVAALEVVALATFVATLIAAIRTLPLKTTDRTQRVSGLPPAAL